MITITLIINHLKTFRNTSKNSCIHFKSSTTNQIKNLYFNIQFIMIPKRFNYNTQY